MNRLQRLLFAAAACEGTPRHTWQSNRMNVGLVPSPLTSFLRQTSKTAPHPTNSNRTKNICCHRHDTYYAIIDHRIILRYKKSALQKNASP